ncbi:MAG: hypothetical protein ABW034_02725 [Steroidobacteraceae bacterium]
MRRGGHGCDRALAMPKHTSGACEAKSESASRTIKHASQRPRLHNLKAPRLNDLADELRREDEAEAEELADLEN